MLYIDYRRKRKTALFRFGQVSCFTIILLFQFGCVLVRPKKTFLANSVSPAINYPGALRASEVPIRGLSPRPVSASDPHNTLQAIRDFHATRLEWIYDLTPEFATQVKALGATLSGAVNTGTQVGNNLTDQEVLRSMAILDLNGQPVFAPWMRAWPIPGRWLCVNNPKVREAYLNALKQLVDLGVKDIQRDDPAGNAAAVSWGACFCEHCITGFQAYLAKNISEKERGLLEVKVDGFNYRTHLLAQSAPFGDDFSKYEGGQLKRLFREFQEYSTVEFHQWSRKELNSYAGRIVPMSANVMAVPTDRIAQQFDFWIGELPMRKATPEGLMEILRASRGRQTLTMPLHTDTPVEPTGWRALTRRTIATGYALGMLVEAPWDTYLPTEKAERHFGKPSDYADLYAMIRASAAYLDGYEAVTVEGNTLDLKGARETKLPATVSPNKSTLHVYPRVKPRDTAAPVVIHLVDWSDQPEESRLFFDRSVIFSGMPVQVELITPREYSVSAHQQAFDSQDYASLIRKQKLLPNKDGSFTVPPLYPWGILVLTLE